MSHRITRHPLCAYLLALTTLVGLTGCGSDMSSDDYLALATKAYEGKQTKVAATNLKQALNANPDNAAARELLARVYVDEGDGSAAEIELDKAEALGISSSSLTLLRLRSLMLQDKYETAIEIANNHLQSSPQDSDAARVVATRGIAELALDDRASAAASFDQALAMSPNTGEALVGKAQLALARNEIDDGLQLAQQATVADSGYAPGWSLLGDVLQFKGDLPGAENAYSEAIAKRSMNADDLLGRTVVRLARNDRAGAASDVATLKQRGFGMPHAAYAEGLLKMAEGDMAAAAERFQAVVSKFPNYVKAVCYSGVAQAMLGSTNRAATELERCLKTYPQASAARRSLAAVLVGLGQSEEAEKTLLPLVNREDSDPIAVGLLADIKLAHNDPGAAVKLLKEVVTRETATARTFMDLGQALTSAGHLDEALGAFDKAAEVDPNLKHADLIAALAMLRNGRADDAIAKLEENLASRPDDVQTQNLMAVALLQSPDASKIERAEKLLTQALAAQPDYTVAALNLASLEFKLNRPEEALKRLDAILAREPSNVRAVGMATAIDMQAGEFARGRERLAKADAAASGNEGDLMLLRARFERAAGDNDAAEKTYQALLSQEGELSLILRELSQTLLAKGQPDKALPLLGKLTKRSDHMPMDWLLIAQAGEQLRDYKTARTAVDRALKEAPDFPAARLADVRLLLMDGKIREAREKFDTLKANAPAAGISELHEADAEILTREGHVAEAIDEYRQAFDSSPTSGRLLTLARAQAAAGQKDETLSTLTTWLQAHPDDNNVRFVLADTYDKLGQTDKAVATYEMLLSADTLNGLALNNLAWLLRERDPAQAVAHAKRAVELLPDSAGVLDTLGMLQLKAGNLDEALDAMRRAHDHAPDNATINLHFAMVLIHKGSMEEARRQLRGIDAGRLPAAERENLTRAQAELGH